MDLESQARRSALKTVKEQAGEAEERVKNAQKELDKLKVLHDEMGDKLLVADELHAQKCELDAESCKWNPQQYMENSGTFFRDGPCDRYYADAEFILEKVDYDVEKAFSLVRVIGARPHAVRKLKWDAIGIQ